MRRISLWLASTVTVVALLLGYHTSTSGPSATTAGGQTVISGAASRTSTSSAASSGGPNGESDPASRTVTGEVAQTQWGPVQVELTVAGGSITDVSVLQYPSGNPQDEQINSYALPQLIQETLDAQSSSIDMVSGATVTSTGYLQSLQSAIDQANL
jgi:uncharacterized protein with FMN-binding domain